MVVAADALPRRAVLYARVSDPVQEREGTSLESQERELRIYAERQGYRVVDMCREVHSGQELWERDVLTSIRDRMRRREFDVLIAYKIDRMARDSVHLGVLMTEAEHYDVEIEFAAEELTKTPEGMLVLQVKAYAAKIEALAIAERTMRGRRTRVMHGKMQGQGGDKYGYTHDRIQGRRLVNEAQAAVVRQIYAWAAEGYGAVAIMRRLESQGEPPPGTGRSYKNGRTPHWSIGTVQRILADAAYKGETFQFQWRQGKKKQTRVARPVDEWVKLPEGTTPPIVSVGLWETVQERRYGPRGAAARNDERPYLLRGLIRCECGMAMSPQLSHGRPVYRCCSRHTASGPCGAPMVNNYKTRRGPGADEEVWNQVVATLANPDEFERQLARHSSLAESAPITANVAAAKRALAKIVSQQERLLARYGQGGDDFPWELVEAQIKRLQAERNRLEYELGELEASRAQAQVQREALEQAHALRAEMAETVHDAPFERRRSALVGLNVRPVANGGRVMLDGVSTQIAHRLSMNASMLTARAF